MKVLVSGASGLVGSAIVAHLSAGGDEARRLSRTRGEGVSWNPETGEVDISQLRNWHGPDAAVHLAGENIASGRWNSARKERIRSSRVGATQKLARTLLAVKPRVFICASAVGHYGNRGDEVLTEESGHGEGFLPEVTAAWENACEPLRAAGVRVVHLRFGMILSANRGALAKMLPIFRAGLGGRLASGKQWISWISLEDAVRAIDFCLRREIRGALNITAPNPVSNAEFTRELSSAVRRPAFIPAPAFALRLAFGEMADALLLSSQRAIPEKLLQSRFAFTHPHLRDALRATLG